VEPKQSIFLGIGQALTQIKVILKLGFKFLTHLLFKPFNLPKTKAFLTQASVPSGAFRSKN